MVKAGLHKATSLMSKTVHSFMERFFHRMTNLFNIQASSLQLSVQIFTLSYVTTTVIWKKAQFLNTMQLKQKHNQNKKDELHYCDCSSFYVRELCSVYQKY